MGGVVDNCVVMCCGVCDCYGVLGVVDDGVVVMDIID